MLLLFPPLTKPCEPPPSLAYLAALLDGHNYPYRVCDMNIEGFTYIIDTAKAGNDTWSKRAYKGRKKNITLLRSDEGYANLDRYKRAVYDLNKILEVRGKKHNLHLTLANYQHNEKSPLQSTDLIRAAHEYKNSIFYPYFSKRLDDLVINNSSEFIGFSLNYLSQALCCFNMIGYLKANFPAKKIVLGGGLITTWQDNIQSTQPFAPLVDYVIPGRGEKLLELLDIKPTKKHIVPSYDSLRENTYLSPGFILPYTGSTGCYWKKCSFCPEKAENNPYQMVAPKQVIHDLQLLTEQTSPFLIHFLDNSINPGLLKGLANNPPGINWYGFSRFEKILLSKDFCKTLKRSGCTMLQLGLESGDQRTLDKLQKGISLQDVSKILKNLHDVSISTYVYLLFGTPSESKQRAGKTLEFIQAHSNLISFLNLSIFNLPRDSAETKQLIVHGFYQGDLSIYSNFDHPLGWGRDTVRRFLDTTLKKSPSIAEIIRNDPPFFTSNHAPFFTT